jgi:hypothetical protein
MMDTQPAPRFFTCCWLVLLALTMLLVGPSTNNSGANAAVQTRIVHWNFNNALGSGVAYPLPIAASSGSGSLTSNFVPPIS